MDAIVVDNVSKRFRIPHEKKTTILQNILGVIRRQFEYEELWALRDVSFAIKQGETFGILGKNGSGKTTLLKILAKVLYPDSGSVIINGMVAPFLELGVGFQPELTAKENVYIYSSILGVSRKEVARNYDEIFEFAELKKFENMKLKNLSSGMSLRLAFSTAIHACPDIMLMDEVFAVGDAAFKEKCVDKIHEFQKQGTSIVFVSHALDTVKSLCDRSVLLHNGRVAALGATEEVIASYHAMLQGIAHVA
jgi:lipopolysaccharide transport system ATP-binding protein